MKSKKTYWKWIAYVLAPFVLSGCLGGSRPDIVSEDKSEKQAYSSDEVRTMAVDRPFMLSGDYFLKRDYPGRPGKDKQDPAAAAQTASGMEAGISQETLPPRDVSQAVKDASARIYKIGVLQGPEMRSDFSARRLSRAAAGVTLVQSRLLGPEQLADVLSAADCGQKDFLACMGEQAALYPGVHMLVAAGPLELPESFPGKAGLKCRVLDAGLGYAYPPLKLTQTIESAGDVDGFVQQALQGALDFAERKADIMPAHCRVFSVKQDRIYISAGTASNVSTGDVFDVVAAGQVADTPAGLPVAWVPNAAKARIRVEMQVRRDISVCSLVEGKVPEIGDYVLLTPLQ